MNSDFLGSNNKRLIIDALILRFHYFERYLKKARKSPTETAIHDLRVMMRRLLSSLDFAAFIFDNSDLIDLYAIIKNYISELNKLRDLQIQEIIFLKLSDQAIVADPIFQYIRRELSKELNCAHSNILKIDLKKISAKFAKCVNAIIRSSISENKIVLKGENKLLLAYNNAIDKFESINLNSPKTAHKFRIAFKKFRYTIEFLQNYLKIERNELSGLKALQDSLGEIQDNSQSIALLLKIKKNADHRIDNNIDFLIHFISAKMNQSIARLLSNRETVINLQKLFQNR